MLSTLSIWSLCWWWFPSIHRRIGFLTMRHSLLLWYVVSYNSVNNSRSYTLCIVELWSVTKCCLLWTPTWVYDNGTPGGLLSHASVFLLVWLSMLWHHGLLQVPRSSKKLSEDNEYALYTVTLFRKVADTFKTSAREKGFQVGWGLCCII